MRTMLVLVLLAFAMPAYAANHAVQIKGMKFNPAKISVAVGDTITFTNADLMTHTATALDGSFARHRQERQGQGISCRRTSIPLCDPQLDEGHSHGEITASR